MTEPSDEEVSVRGGDTDRREVIVPLRIYKTVTVFSTLLAVIGVVLGFAFLDAATVRGGLFGLLAGLIPFEIPLPLAASTVDMIFVLLGLACIGLGAGIYVLGSRFRTAEMGKGKDGGGGPENDG